MKRRLLIISLGVICAVAAAGMVIIYNHHDGANVKKWCKEVTLISPSP